MTKTIPVSDDREIQEQLREAAYQNSALMRERIRELGLTPPEGHGTCHGADLVRTPEMSDDEPGIIMWVFDDEEEDFYPSDDDIPPDLEPGFDPWRPAGGA